MIAEAEHACIGVGMVSLGLVFTNLYILVFGAGWIDFGFSQSLLETRRSRRETN